MIQSPERDPRVEFVLEQLKRVHWISGHSFVEDDGYRLNWSPEGCHRMMLLQIVLRGGDDKTLGPVGEEHQDTGAHAAVRDFWEACVAQLALAGEQESLPAFVRIIESWRPASGAGA